MNNKVRKKIASIREKLETPDARKFIENKLNSIQELPEKGLCLGQSVASAAIEFLGMTNEIIPIYNDIDIFDVHGHLFQYSSEGLSNVIQKGYEAPSLLETDKLFRGITNKEDYMGLSSGLSGKYRIGEITKDNLLNTISLFIADIGTPFPVDSLSTADKKVKTLTAKKIIESFDINTTKIGFDIESNTSIIVDDSFLLFLITKQIELDQMTHPVNAFLRGLKKKEEMGVYFDEKKYASVIFPYLGVIDKIGDNIEGQINALGIEENTLPQEIRLLRRKKILTPKYVELFNRYESSFEDCNLDINKDGIGEVFYTNSDSSDKTINNFMSSRGEYLFGDHEESKKIFKEKIINAFRGDVHKLVKPIYDNLPVVTEEENDHMGIMFEKRRGMHEDEELSVDDEVVDSYRKAVLSGGIMNMIFSLPEAILSLSSMKKSSIIALSEIYEDQNSSIENKRMFDSRISFLKRVSKEGLTPGEVFEYKKEKKKFIKLNQRRILNTLHGDATSLRSEIEILKKINIEAKKSLDFIGKIETNMEKFISMGGWELLLEDDFVETFMAEERAEKKKEILPYFDDAARYIKTEQGNCSARLLSTGEQLQVEGDRMNHCVSGYTEAVKDRGTLIFHIEGKSLSDKFFSGTLELVPFKQKSEYRVNQFRGTNNQVVTVNENIVSLFIEMNKKVNLFGEPTEDNVRNFLRFTGMQHLDFSKVSGMLTDPGTIKPIVYEDEAIVIPALNAGPIL